MSFILKLILIILLNKTYAYISQDSEISLLPAWNPTEIKEISLTLKVFGKLIQLKLQRNDQVSSPFEAWKNNARHVTEKLSKLNASDFCFYFHKDHVSSAVINCCQEYGLKGLISVENDILKIRPFGNVYAPLFFNSFCVKKEINQSFGKPYLITKFRRYIADLDSYHFHKIRTKRFLDLEKIFWWWSEKFGSKKTFKISFGPSVLPRKKAEFAIKLAVFVDAEAFRTLMAFLKNVNEYIQFFIFKCVRNIQTSFHHPSLGVPIDIMLVRLEVVEELSFLKINDTSVLKLLCQYTKNFNPRADKDPRHWNIALLIIDFQTLQRSGELQSRFHRNTACKNVSCALVILTFKTSYDWEDDKNRLIEQLSYGIVRGIGRV